MGINIFIRVSFMCGKRGAYTWSNTSGREKVGLSAGVYMQRGAYRLRNTVYRETFWPRSTGKIKEICIYLNALIESFLFKLETPIIKNDKIDCLR